MTLKHAGLVSLLFISHIFQIAFTEEEIFRPSARVIYIKRSPDGPLIKYSDVEVSNTTSKISDEFLLASSKAENEENNIEVDDKDAGMSSYSSEILPSLGSNEEADGNRIASSLNLTYDDIFSGVEGVMNNTHSIVEGRDGRSIADFPYEFWKPLSRLDVEIDSKTSDSQEKRSYGFYYGDPVDNNKESDSSTWTVHPIKLPVDVIGEVNEKTTKNPLKEQTNYPSSIIPQYGRHPGATEPPPLYFPNSLSSKNSVKQPQILRDRVGMEDFSSHSNKKSLNIEPIEALKQFRRPQMTKSKEVPDNEAIASRRIEIISTDRNSDPPPHIFYPITDTSKLQVGLLRKNKTHSFYASPFKRENDLISTLHAKTRQIFKRPFKPTNPGHKHHNSDYDILDYSRYDMQKRLNPKIERKKYNENLIDIIKDKFIRNQNDLRERDHQKRSRIPFRPTTLAHGFSGNHGQHRENSTNLVKYYSNDMQYYKNHKIQNPRPNTPTHQSRITNAMQMGNHKDLTVNLDLPHNLRSGSSILPKTKSQQMIFKRPSQQKHPKQDYNLSVQQLSYSQPNNEQEGKPSDNVSISGSNRRPLPQKNINYFDRSKNDISTYANPAPRPVVPKEETAHTHNFGQPKPSWLKSFVKDKQDSFSKPYHQKPTKPEYYHKQNVKQDYYRPPRPVSTEGAKQSFQSQHDPALEVQYDNSLKAKLSRLWNVGFQRKPKPAPNAYPQFGHPNHSSKKDSKNLLYYYFDSNEEDEHVTKPEDKTFLERIASIQYAPAAVVIPGGMAAFGLGLAYYYFNYIWYPTPVVTARLSDLLITYADNTIFNDKQKSDIEKVVEVFSGLESKYFTNTINTVSCRNRLVCQLHQDIPSLWEVTQLIVPVVSSQIEEQSPDEIRAFKNYVSVAKQGVEGTSSCKELFKSCNIPYLPLKPLLNSIFKGSSKTENEYGESRVL